MVIGLVVFAILFQLYMNKSAVKRGYGFNKKQQGIAILASGFLWYHLLTIVGPEKFNLTVFLLGIAMSLLVSIIFIDFNHYIIPDGYNLTLLVIGLAYVGMNFKIWDQLLIGGVVAFGAFFLLMVVGNLGGGDVKLAGCLGLILGINHFMEFLIVSLIAGAFISVILLVCKLRKKEDKIAFGPYIALAFLYVVL